MGTDIHGRVQKRWSLKSQYEDVGPIEDERSYAVFAMLAGVRNGFGFAGVKTHEPLAPISEPRGLPSDNAKYDGEDADWAFGEHSQSWLTLREVLDWAGWDQDLLMTGIVDRDEYERLIRENDTPREWCGGRWGGDVIQTTQEAVESGSAPEGWNCLTYSWRIPFRDRVRLFRLWLDYLEAKHEWLLKDDPAAIRIVFGFDS
jgi:hypothetical protein